MMVVAYCLGATNTAAMLIMTMAHAQCSWRKKWIVNTQNKMAQCTLFLPELHSRTLKERSLEKQAEKVGRCN